MLEDRAFIMHLVGVLRGVDDVIAAPAEALGADGFRAVLFPQLLHHGVDVAGCAAVRLEGVGGDELAKAFACFLRCIAAAMQEQSDHASGRVVGKVKSCWRSWQPQLSLHLCILLAQSVQV